MIYIGIDTGAKGAIAAIGGAPQVWPMPVVATGAGASRHVYNTRELARILGRLRDLHDVGLVVVEQLAGFPPGTNAAAIQAAAAGPALFEGLCSAFGLPYRFAGPQEWQRAMLKLPKLARAAAGDDPKARDAARRERRRVLKATAVVEAMRLFPGVDLMASERSRVPSDGIADALLLAEYGRRIHTGGELFAAAERSQTSATEAEPEDVFAG